MSVSALMEAIMQFSRLEMAIANGTLVNISKSSHSHIWHAAQVKAPPPPPPPHSVGVVLA